MESFKIFFRQKQLWLGVALVAAVIAVLSFALLGSTVNPTPKNLPVALVMEDAGAKLPDGSAINFGRIIEAKLTGAPLEAGSGTAAGTAGAEGSEQQLQSPLKWVKEADANEARAALDSQDYYAVLHIPADTTAKLLSLQTPAAEPAPVEVLLNQGKNATGSTMTGQVLEKMLAAVNAGLREQLLSGIDKRGGMLSTVQAAALASPLAVTQTVVHPIPAKTANGNAPVTLTQLVWMAALVSSVMQLQTSRKTGIGKRSYSLLMSQITSGLLFGLAAVGFILILTIPVIGLHIPDFWPVAGFLLFTFCCFFLLQSTLLQYTGMAGMPVLVVLFFFGLPVLTLPYELLPGLTQDWFFSWVPFRFSVEGLRDLFYFRQGLGWKDPALVLGCIGLGSLLLLLLSPLASKHKHPDTAANKKAFG
jgi:hypothetical protein